ncbi:MAG TPA: translocation/assembly module TamB domain-containing protein, partial [Paludibacter sp.]|nr:translocation/assembly module TamB domain-containing protein [Paludibacter sp.]
TSLGNANLTAELDASQRFDTKLELNELDLGSVLKDKNKYGPVSLTASAKGRGLDPTTLKANIKAQVSKIHLNKYTYHNLNIDGDIAGRRFAGKVKMEDKNADFEFDGLVDMNPGQEYYKFSFNVLVANLQKLNFTQRDMRIGFTATADLKGGRMEKLNGKAGITNLVIASEGKIYKLDSLFVASVNKGNQSEFSINSAIVGLKYNGSTSPVNLPASLTRFLNNYFPFGGSETAKTDTASSNFAFEIVLHNHPLISEILLPELKEFQPGSISGSFDSKKNELKISAEINKIQYGSLQVDDLNFDVNSNANELEYSISSSGISNSQVRFGNFIFNGKMGGNKILANVTSTDEKNTRKLLLHSQLTKPNGNYKFELLPDEFYLMNTRWDIANDNYIEFGKSGLRVHNLLLTNAGSEIKIASVHDRFNDDLNFSLKNFSLDDISHIIEKDTSLVGGQMDGKVMLKQLNKTYGIVANATVRNMEINGIPIGNLHLKAENPNPDKFDIDLSLKGTSNNLKINGQYNPNGGDNSLAFKILVDSLSMKTIEAFSFGQITESSGNVEGDFSVTGKTDSPQITGELVFNNVLLKPAVINNRLELKHETIRMNPNGIYFNAFTMLDPQHHPATIDGSVGMKQFSDFVFGLKVTTKDFMLFNTTASGNKDFYGKMLIDSKIDVSGPISLPVVNARLKMKEGSNFTYVVPEDRFTTNKGEGTVEFNDSSKLNPILLAGEDKAKPTTQLSGFDLSSIIEVDKKASLRLLMDPSSSDSLVVKGEAALSLTMDRSGKMSLTGAYNLVDGSYLVSLQSLIKRNFDINAGSTITWNGDPFDAGISIDATYNVKTAPIDLVADQIAGMSEADKAGYKMKYPFQVVLKLRGELMKPEISFEIQLPPGEKGILGGAVTQKLNMLNEDPSALNKQVFALLVLGRFVQENPLQTEAGGGTSVLLRSTVGNFLSSQLNMLSSKLVPGVDINFDIQSYDDYQAGQAGGRTQVEIGLKKQLFNQRFTVQLGGTLDVEGERAKQNSASDITGDVSVEYKVTEDGRYRLKGFRKNRYEGAIEGQVVETGAGIVYVRNFNVWKDIFKKPVKKPANE